MEEKKNGSDKNVGSIEEDIERCEQLTKTEHANWIGLSNQQAIEHLIKAYKELKEENKILKANHIITHNKTTDEEKAKIFDVIDRSIDTYLEKSKPYWERIMPKERMTIEEAETIINDMYQDKNKILENNNIINISKLDDVKFTNLEFASVRLLREIQSLEHKLENSIPVSLVEEKIEEINNEDENLMYKHNIIRVLQELLEGE